LFTKSYKITFLLFWFSPGKFVSNINETVNLVKMINNKHIFILKIRSIVIQRKLKCNIKNFNVNKTSMIFFTIPGFALFSTVRRVSATPPADRTET